MLSWVYISLSPLLFDSLLSSAICKVSTENNFSFLTNAGLDELQAGIKTDGRNINNLQYTDDTTLIAEREEELKNLLICVKEESEKADLINIKKLRS